MGEWEPADKNSWSWSIPVFIVQSLMPWRLTLFTADESYLLTAMCSILSAHTAISFFYHSCILITFVLYYFGTMCKIYCVVREMDLLCICEWRWFALASVPISINLMSSCKLSEGMCYLKSEGPCFFEYSYELILIYFIQYNFMAQKYTLKLEYFHIMVE